VVNWPLIIHAVKGEDTIYSDGVAGKMANRLAGFWRLRA